MNKLPKLILSDIDGVWTDGGMYYSDNGVELKKFHTYDSAGVLFCKMLKIPVGIITGENINVVQKRANKLGMDYCFLGAKNKPAIIEKVLKELKISWEDVAYLGDDLNDIGMLKKVGFAGVVSSAPEYIKRYADYVTEKKGGEGAFREFVEVILKNNRLLDKIIERIEYEKISQ